MCVSSLSRCVCFVCQSLEGRAVCARRGGSGVLVLCLGRFLSVGSCGRELGRGGLPVATSRAAAREGVTWEVAPQSKV